MEQSKYPTSSRQPCLRVICKKPGSNEGCIFSLLLWRHNTSYQRCLFSNPVDCLFLTSKRWRMKLEILPKKLYASWPWSQSSSADRKWLNCTWPHLPKRWWCSSEKDALLWTHKRSHCPWQPTSGQLVTHECFFWEGGRQGHPAKKETGLPLRAVEKFHRENLMSQNRNYAN